MIVLVAEHVVNKGQAENANKIFRMVSDSVRKTQGFVSRQILVSKKDANVVTTVTTFQSQEAFEKWRQNLKIPEADLKKAFSKVNSISYDVRESIS